MKKVCLNPLIVYDFFYEKIKNCDDLELIGNDKKAYNIINKLIEVKEIKVDKNLYDPNKIVVNKADVYFDDSSKFLGIYFVSGTGFDISEEIQTVKDCLDDECFEFNLSDITLLEPDNWFLVTHNIEPYHKYDIIVFTDILVNALENYKPIHLENGKLISNSPKDFDIINFIIGNLGVVIPRYVVERILELSGNEIDHLDLISTRFGYDLVLLQLIAYYKYLQKVYNGKISDIKKFLLRFMIDLTHSSILFDINYKDLIEHRKILRKIEELSNVNDEIKESIIDYSIILYQASNLRVNNIKLVK